MYRPAPLSNRLLCSLLTRSHQVCSQHTFSLASVRRSAFYTALFLSSHFYHVSYAVIPLSDLPPTSITHNVSSPHYLMSTSGSHSVLLLQSFIPSSCSNTHTQTHPPKNLPTHSPLCFTPPPFLTSSFLFYSMSNEKTPQSPGLPSNSLARVRRDGEGG